MDRSELREAIRKAIASTSEGTMLDGRELVRVGPVVDAVLTVLDQQREARRAGFETALRAYVRALNSPFWDFDKVEAARTAVIAAAGFEVKG